MGLVSEFEFGYTLGLATATGIYALMIWICKKIAEEQSLGIHAPDEVGGTDEPSEGQAMGSERAEEGES